MANQPHIVKPAAAPLQNFKTDVIAPLKKCKVHFSPMQDGTGDPSPSNVRPITGWTGVSVYKTGKNLINENHRLDGAQFKTVNGVYQIGSANVYSVCSLPVPKNTDLHIGKSVVTGSELALGDVVGTMGTPVVAVGSMTNYYNRNFNSGEHPYAYLMFGKSTTLSDPTIKWQLEFGNAATAYEAPKGMTELSVTFPSSAGTVYGGYVDLVSGEVWKTYQEINITELGSYRTLGINNNNNTQVSWFLVNHLNVPEATGYVPYSRDGYCSCAPFYVNNYYWNSKCQVNNSTADLVIEEELTAEEVDNWIKAHAPIQIVYPLKTPELIGSITPQTLKTLRGTNNIWSNANGDIQLSYWKH